MRFEEYLASRAISDYQHERQYEGKSKIPDYTVKLDGEYLLEVKDFEPTEIEDSGWYDPHRRIRGKIKEASKKFKEYKGRCCCLVLYSNNAALVDLETPFVMLGAMYGNYGVTVPIDPSTGSILIEESVMGFNGGGKLQPKQNTTISAVITLREIEVGPQKLGKYLEVLKETGIWEPLSYTKRASLSR